MAAIRAHSLLGLVPLVALLASVSVPAVNAAGRFELAQGAPAPASGQPPEDEKTKREKEPGKGEKPRGEQERPGKKPEGQRPEGRRPEGQRPDVRVPEGRRQEEPRREGPRPERSRPERSAPQNGDVAPPPRREAPTAPAAKPPVVRSAPDETEPRRRAPAPPPADKREAPPSLRAAPSQRAPTAPPAAVPELKQAPTAPAKAPPASEAPAPGAADAKSAAPPVRLDTIRRERQERVEDGGRRTIVQEPGGRTIVRQDNRVFIQHNEVNRFERVPGSQTVRRPDGVSETFYVRPNGVRIVTEVDSRGQLLRRYRRDRDGREIILVDNRRFWRGAAIGAGIGLAAIGIAATISLPPPRIAIARERYYIDYDRASDDELYETLSAPPFEELERPYSLVEVIHSHDLRQRMRRVDLDVNFEFGAFDVTPDQFSKLERLASMISRVIDRDPTEVFLIEGYTDAVGSDFDNLSLSDRRAEAVAQVLTDVFKIPAENLVTQGYGEQHLKIETDGPERANRRVAVRRITPLMAERNR